MKCTVLLRPVVAAGLMMVMAPAFAADPEVPPAIAPALSGDAISQGLWWLYQLQYDKAYAIFDQYTQDHPEDAAGYFYKSGTDWWHLAQQFDYALPKVQARFYENVARTIEKANTTAASTKDRKIKARAYLYRGGAEGMRGRWLVTQKQWVKAYFAGKNGDHFLKLALKYDPTLYDAYMGLGIYDYFTDTLGGVQKALAALLVHGDRARGLKELHTAIEKGQRARVEAMIFLIEIYTSEERTPEKALPLTRELREEFPQSPAMHLAEVMALYSMKDWDAMTPSALEFLDRSEKETPYYTHEGIRPALYVLAIAEFWGHKNPETSLPYINRIFEGGVDSSRWVTFAYLRRGQIHDLHGERQEAIEDYRRVLDRQDFWGAHREAHLYLNERFHF
jgi:tetratricopeptide (TPR) repeat protein